LLHICCAKLVEGANNAARRTGSAIAAGGTDGLIRIAVESRVEAKIYYRIQADFGTYNSATFEVLHIADGLFAECEFLALILFHLICFSGN
jgi:hypothetical protein